MAPKEEPILFLWAFSPWASKVVSYLALRGIPHARCEQPITQPRPDLASLGVRYRRIPVLSIGRDIYCDTIIILEKLEEIYASEKEYKRIGASTPTEMALEKLLEKWTDMVVFKPAAALIPTDMDLMKDPQFQRDREELWGRKWTKEAQDALRPAALANVRANFDFLETVLSDGRQWILGGETGPMLADIHACWIFDWLFKLPGAFPEEFFSANIYPRTHAWRDRYNAAIAKARENALSPVELRGPEAVSRILSSGFQDNENELTVHKDPCGLQQGQDVIIYPVDTGYNSKDGGKLVGLNINEAVLKTMSQPDGREMRIHFPRWNFAIEAVSDFAVSGK